MTKKHQQIEWQLPEKTRRQWRIRMRMHTKAITANPGGSLVLL
jgi:hypothetical protein